MTLDQASEEFMPIISPLREAWRTAWTDILSTYNNPDWDERCRSTVLQMQAVGHAKRLLGAVDGVTYINFEKRHLFQFADLGLIQLKQLDAQLRSKNYQTPRAAAFSSQTEIKGLEGLPRFTVGLVPDADWIDFVGIYFTYPNSTVGNNWALDITGQPVDVNANQGAFEEPTFKVGSRWKPKRASTDISANGV